VTLTLSPVKALNVARDVITSRSLAAVHVTAKATRRPSAARKLSFSSSVYPPEAGINNLGRRRKGTWWRLLQNERYYRRQPGRDLSSFGLSCDCRHVGVLLIERLVKHIDCADRFDALLARIKLDPGWRIEFSIKEVPLTEVRVEVNFFTRTEVDSLKIFKIFW